jgi:hypothetical protein
VFSADQPTRSRAFSIPVAEFLPLGDSVTAPAVPLMMAVDGVPRAQIPL